MIPLVPAHTSDRFYTKSVAPRSMGPSTFLTSGAFLIFMGTLVILANTNCSRSTDSDNYTSTQSDDARHLLWSTKLPEDLKYRARQVTIISDATPVILATRPGKLFQFKDDAVTQQVRLESPSTVQLKTELGEDVILPYPNAVTQLSDTPVGILRYRNHSIAQFRLIDITGKTLAKLEDPRHFHFRIAPDGNTFLGVDSMGRHIGITAKEILYRFFNRTGTIIGEVRAHPFSWDDFTYTPDGVGILINDKEGGLSFYEARTAKRLWSTSRVHKYFASANGSIQRVIAVQRENRGKADLYEKGKLVWSIDISAVGVNENIRNVAISPQGNLIAITSGRSLLILESGSTIPVGRFELQAGLIINSVSVSSRGRVAIGAQQADLKGNESSFGSVLVLDRKGLVIFQEKTHHERSNAWIPKVRFDSSGQILLMQTRELVGLRAVN